MRLTLTADDGTIVAHYNDVSIEQQDDERLHVMGYLFNDDHSEPAHLLFAIASDDHAWDDFRQNAYLAQERNDAVEFTEHVFLCGGCHALARIARDALDEQIKTERYYHAKETISDDQIKRDAIENFEYCLECVGGEPVNGEHVDLKAIIENERKRTGEHDLNIVSIASQIATRYNVIVAHNLIEIAIAHIDK